MTAEEADESPMFRQLRRIADALEIIAAAMMRTDSEDLTRTKPLDSAPEPDAPVKRRREDPCASCVPSANEDRR